MKQQRTIGRIKLYGKLNKFQKPKLLKALKDKPFLKPLAEKLISIGGEVPCIWNDSLHNDKMFVEILLHFGRLATGKKARLKRMESNACHANSELLELKYPHLYQRETGYALSGRVWAPHSWVFDWRKNQIVETTCLRDKYFGFSQRVSESERDILEKEGYCPPEWRKKAANKNAIREELGIGDSAVESE